MNVLLIGYGAISREIIKHIGADEPARISAVLVRPARLDEARAALPDDIQVVTDLDDLLMVPDLAAECAGHQAVAQYGAEILRRDRPTVHLYVRPASCIEPEAEMVRVAKALAGYRNIFTEDGKREQPHRLFSRAWLEKRDFTLVATDREWEEAA